MIDYKKHTLKNGLTILAHRDKWTPIAAVNVLYKVGSRNENPERTGFAHLFEHLMFSGSKNVKSFDTELQKASGENNAFTCNDYTCYYMTLPKNNIETAFWLESDRMMHPNITLKNLETQKNVVIEEFNQRYLNQPYGDIWMLLRPLAYKTHPYRWTTIGKNIDHIKNAKLEDVKSFFDKYYKPSNSILGIAADIEPEKIFEMAEKWFGEIPNNNITVPNVPKEPKQTEYRELKVERKVPISCLYKAYKMCNRQSRDYYVFDLLTDILSGGRSARFNQNLVKNTNMFSAANAYISGDIDDGLLILSGMLLPKTNIKKVEKAIDNEIQNICTIKIGKHELEKVKNKAESAQIFSETSIQNKAMFLCYYQNLNRLDLLNNELKIYKSITANDIQRVAKNTFKDTNCSTLYYMAKK